MSATWGKGHRLALLVLAVLACGLYANTPVNDFMWDDTNLIEHNRHIQSLANTPLFFTPHYWNDLHPYHGQGQYRPVRTVTFALDYALWGLAPAGYHATNLVLNMLAVLLVYLFVLRLVSADNRVPAETHPGGNILLPLVTAAVFAAHPVHTESVAYVKNRSDLLAFIFCLCAFLLFTAYPGPRGRPARVAVYAGALFCFTLALLSKEIAVVFPFLLAAYVYCFVPKPEWKNDFFRTVPFFGGVALFFWFRLAFLETAVEKSVHFDAWQHLLVVIKTLGWYLQKLTLPVHLNAEHVFDIPGSLTEPPVLGAITGLCLLGAGLIFGLKKSKWLVFALCWLVLFLGPVSNIVFLESRPVAEQRLFFPSLGFSLLVGLGVIKMMGRGNRPVFRSGSALAAMAAVTLLLGFYSVQTVRRNADWRDPLTFYAKTVADSPGSFRAQLNFGVALAEQGRLDEAMTRYRNALAIKPDYAMAYYKIGNVLMKKNQLTEAAAQYEKAIRIRPGYAHAHNNMGVVLMRLGRIRQAIPFFSRATTLLPDYVDAWNNYGAALANTGRYGQAAECFSRALEIDPESREAAGNLKRLSGITFRR